MIAAKKPTTPTLSRRRVPWGHRPAAFVSPWASYPLSTHIQLAADTGLRTLYLVGGDRAATTPDRAYLLAPAGDGWRVSNYLRDPGKATGARYTRGDDTVDVHMSSQWFGDEQDGGECRVAYTLLKAALKRTFDPGATLMATPGRTGLDLVQRSLPFNTEYPAMPGYLQSIIRQHCGQGRQEYIGGDAEWHAPALYWLDARWQYAACLRNLPVGEPEYIEHWRRREFDAYAPAFYCVSFQVPQDWRYPLGLLPEPYDAPDGELRTRWPATPGKWALGWCTGAELQEAQKAQWKFHIKEAIRFPQTGTLADPLRTFIGSMRGLREVHTGARLVAAAARHIVLDTVGSFWRTARAEQRSVSRNDVASVPSDAYDVQLVGDRIDYRIDTPLHADLLQFQHPEWSAMVWGRARARLVRAALRYWETCPAGRIAWLRSDALVVDTDPGWTDDGAVGTFRLKRTLAQPDIAVPHDELGYRTLLLDNADGEDI